MTQSGRQQRRSQHYRSIESRFDFTALYIIGGDQIGAGAGPLRLSYSSDPKERLRVILRNCPYAKLSGMRVLHQLWLAGESNAKQVYDLIHSTCLKLGLHSHDDFYSVTLPVGISLIEESAKRYNKTLITDEQKASVIKRQLSKDMLRS